MELVAAIDLLDGRARRLVQGDYGRPLDASADPLRLARRWLAAGVGRLHVVDLDGARVGRPVHAHLVKEVIRLVADVSPNARVECGGGLRDLDSVASMLDTGVHDVILGSAAVNDPTFLAQAAVRWPGRVGAALDLRAGRPAVDGWTGERAADPFALATQLLVGGASRLVVTDITRDGTGAGPNLQLMAAFRGRFPKAVLVAAGGVGTTAHLAALARLELDGVIVGRALLDGSLDIADALAACAGEVFA